MSKIPVVQMLTHRGDAEAHTVLAMAILHQIYPEAGITQTDEEHVAGMIPQAALLDIGGICDPARNRFDPCDQKGPLHEDGTPYTSLAMVWDLYGKEYLESLKVRSKGIDHLHQAVMKYFVLPIDHIVAGGNKQEMYRSKYLRGIDQVMLITNDKVESEPLLDLERARGMCHIYLATMIHQEEDEIRVSKHVRDRIRKTTGPVLELTETVKYHRALTEAGEEAAHIQFIVRPRRPGWIAIAPEDRPDQKVLFPESWAGLSNEDLARATGIMDAFHCTEDRRLVFTLSRKGAYQAAELALQHVQPDPGPSP